MAEKKKILYIVEAMGGGVFTYIVDLANELVNSYDMYIAYAVRKQTPQNYRVSDFTIWDCFNVGRFSKELDNDKGATRVLVHTKKGREIFNAIKDDFSYVEIAPEAAIAGAKEMKESVASNGKRESFFKDANRMSGEELFNKYFPETFKVKVEHCIRLTCYKLGIYSAAKKLYVRLTHKY